MSGHKNPQPPLIDLSHVTPAEWDATLNEVLAEFGDDYEYPEYVPYGYEVPVASEFDEPSDEIVRCIIGECMSRLGADLGRLQEVSNSTSIGRLVRDNKITIHPDVEAGYLDTIQALQDGRCRIHEGDKASGEPNYVTFRDPMSWGEAVSRARQGERNV